MRKILLLSICISFMMKTEAQVKATVSEINQNTKNIEYKRQFSLADSGLFSVWNSGAWEATVLRTYTYNSNNSLDLVFEKKPLTGEIINEVKYTYDANENLIKVYAENYVEATKNPLIRQTFAFDNKGNRTSSLTEQYDTGNQTWTVLYGDSFEFVYDAKDQIISYTLYQQTSQGISPYQKLIWDDFDKFKIPQTLTVQVYSNGFENYIRLENMKWLAGYDYAQFDPSSYFGYLWDGGTQKWNPSVYDTSVFTSSNRIRKYLFTWNGSTLDSSAKTEYRYDTKGHRVETISYTRAGQGWSLSDGSQDSIVYGFDDVTLERYYSYFDKNTEHWVYQEKEKYYFNSLDVKKPENPELAFFPNPAKDYIQLKNSDLEINKIIAIGMDGKRIPLTLEGNKIKTHSLETGVYILQIETLKGIQRGRLVIK